MNTREKLAARRPRFGATRRLPCGCVNQYGMYQSNVGSWAKVVYCGRKHPAPEGEIDLTRPETTTQEGTLF